MKTEIPPPSQSANNEVWVHVSVGMFGSISAINLKAVHKRSRHITHGQLGFAHLIEQRANLPDLPPTLLIECLSKGA